ncbi:hypothetical protein B7P43_G01870 [Cryptotermes secundus]|uniref:Uncharacterized protein n=2 Tax=Cryptotermes secundus TaxID=105785 RepID=A0A2J7QWC1_9NEOP|nr:hypothetical protein B7P43_G01870 [Cryptotermes secundus]
MLDREGRREKILEARNREIRLRQRTKIADNSHRDILERETLNKPSLISDPAVQNAEKEFFTVIEMELAALKAETEASEQDEEYGIKPEVASSEETGRKKNRFLKDEFEGANFEEEDCDEDQDVEGDDFKQQ